MKKKPLQFAVGGGNEVREEPEAFDEWSSSRSTPSLLPPTRPSHPLPDWSLLTSAPPARRGPPWKLRPLRVAAPAPWGARTAAPAPSSAPLKTVTRIVKKVEEKKRETPKSALSHDRPSVANSPLAPRPAALSPAPKKILPFPPRRQPMKPKIKFAGGRFKSLAGLRFSDENDYLLAEDSDVLYCCQVLVCERGMDERLKRVLEDGNDDGIGHLIVLFMKRSLEPVKISEWADHFGFDEYYLDSRAKKACSKLPPGIIKIKGGSFVAGEALDEYSELSKIVFSHELKELIKNGDGRVSEKDIRSDLGVALMMENFSTLLVTEKRPEGGHYYKMKKFEH